MTKRQLINKLKRYPIIHVSTTVCPEDSTNTELRQAEQSQLMWDFRFCVDKQFPHLIKKVIVKNEEGFTYTYTIHCTVLPIELFKEIVDNLSSEL